MSLSQLDIACCNGDQTTVEQLLSKLSLDDINQIEPNDSTSLHVSCYNNHFEIVKYLLDAGASSTILNKYGLRAMDEETSEEIKQLFPSSDKPLSSAVF